MINRQSKNCRLGHTEATSGVAGLIKVALCMRYRQIPAQMHFSKINPKIKAQQYNLHIVQNLTRFPPNQQVTFGINSFGMGGNNSHAIVEEYVVSDSPAMPAVINGHPHSTYQQPYMAIFSGKCFVSNMIS
jgi:acyl transferase domain-containing protein